jgi:thiol-disulfide isomerase/thioredoxin
MEKRLLAGCGLIAALVAAPTMAQAAAPADAAQIQVATLTGAPFDLAALRGKVVLVHFWATWCPPCITEMPALSAFYDRYRERGVEVIALSEDRTRDLDAVQHMVQHMHMSYPVAMAHRAKLNSFGDPAALPVTYVLDGQGVVRAEMRPDKEPLTEQSLAREVDPLLAPGLTPPHAP